MVVTEDCMLSSSEELVIVEGRDEITVGSEEETEKCREEGDGSKKLVESTN